MIEPIAQKVPIAPLPAGFRQDLCDGPFQARVVIADHQMHSVQPALLETE